MTTGASYDFGFAEGANSVALQADGKILVAGTSNFDFALLRYNPNGALDTTFSGDGALTTDFGSIEGVENVTVQANGKILVVGHSGLGFTLARYNSDGSLDTSFSGDGKQITSFPGFNVGAAFSAAMQANGKILVAGNCGTDFALVRYNSNGSLDTTFSGDGMLTTDFGSSEGISSVTVQADGKILAAGTISTFGVSDFALARYNTDGSLDTSFSSDGILTTDFGSGDTGRSITVQADGKILVAGSGSNNNDFALARYNSDGSLDTTFSSDGLLTTDFFGSTDQGYSVTVQIDNKILVAGYSYNGLNYDFALTRYNSDGSLDATFSGDGKLATDLGYVDQGYSIKLQTDGKILVAGGSNDDFALVRYNADGTLDTGFGLTDGAVLASSPGTDTLAGTGSNNDTATYASAASAVTVSLSTTTQQNTIGAGLDTLTSIENLVGSNFNDNLKGDGKSNSLNGGIGNDILDGGAGPDSLIGGLGDDSYFIDHVGDIIVENLGEGNDKVNSSITYTLPVNVENLTLTGLLDINGTGNDLANNVSGNAGFNVLNGGGGNDTLNGGVGMDTMIGGLGNDSYVVDNVGDVVIENLDEGTDKINSSITYTLPANVENLTLTGTLTINGTGNNLNNTIIGNTAANQLSGGIGNDTYFVDNASDVVIENLNEGTDKINSSITYTLPANVENLTLTGTLTINGTGNNLNNTIIGNAAANQLNGGIGNDKLSGGTGTNTLTGGAGKDIFQFVTAGHIDTITDFVVADDTIQLENAVFTALTTLGTLAADQFRIGSNALDVNDYIIYNDSTGALLYDADGSGAGVAQQVASLSAGLSMTNLDIVVI